MKIAQILRIFCKIVLSKLHIKQYSLTATISVTNRCNSQCSYCGYGFRHQNDISLDKIKNIIKISAKSGIERLGIWGGEPLLRDDIEQIIDYTVYHNLYVTLDTNGFLVKEKIQIIKKVNHVVLSFDGLRKMHDLNRGIGSYDKVIEAIEALYSNNINFSTITVLTKNNISKDNIDYILSLSEKYKFSTTFQILHHNNILGSDYENIFPSHQEYVDIFKYIRNMKKNNKFIASSYSYLDKIIKWKDYGKAYLLGKSIKDGCFAGLFYFNIDSDGKLYPCSVLVGQIDGAEYNEKDIPRLLNGNRKKINCKDCICGCFAEYNDIFGLKFSTMFQWLKNLI